MKDSRFIDGKLYTLYNFYHTKKEADDFAKKYRAQGYLLRIIKRKPKNYLKPLYCIYVAKR